MINFSIFPSQESAAYKAVSVLYSVYGVLYKYGPASSTLCKFPVYVVFESSLGPISCIMTSLLKKRERVFPPKVKFLTIKLAKENEGSLYLISFTPLDYTKITAPN